jgi:hypothetical protein
MVSPYHRTMREAFAAARLPTARDEELGRLLGGCQCAALDANVDPTLVSGQRGRYQWAIDSPAGVWSDDAVV